MKYETKRNTIKSYICLLWMNLYAEDKSRPWHCHVSGKSCVVLIFWISNFISGNYLYSRQRRTSDSHTLTDNIYIHVQDTRGFSWHMNHGVIWLPLSRSHWIIIISSVQSKIFWFAEHKCRTHWKAIPTVKISAIIKYQINQIAFCSFATWNCTCKPWG